MPTFKCRHIGYECSFEASATSEDELMKKVVEKEHGYEEVPPELYNKIRRGIKKEE
ncbi:MAG: DUF1059 domain-containing protein [Methanomassiliicoccales archaeon]